MEMGQALLARLGAGSATQPIAGARIHWVARPQGEDLPAVVLNTVSESRPQHLAGFDDMRTARVQASAFALKYGDARALIEAVIADLVPVAEVEDVRFWRADVEGPRDLGDQPDSGGFVHHVTADLIIRYAKSN